MRSLLWIAVKDLKSTVRDRTALFWLTLGPMLIVGLISAAYSGFSGSTNMAAQTVPGFSLMFMFFGIAAVGESIFEERDNATLHRMLISSVSKGQLLGGKLLAGYAISLGQMLLLFGMGYLVFKVPFGYSAQGRVAVLLVLISGCLAALCFGLFIASLFSTRKQFSAFFTVAVLAMCQIGGAWMPLFLMPDWMRELSRLTFISHAMEAFNLTHFGQGLSAVLPNVGVLMIYAAVCLILSFYLFEMNEASRQRKRRKVIISVAALSIIIYTGSRVNAISFPSFIEDDRAKVTEQAGGSNKEGDGDASKDFQAAKDAWEKKDAESALRYLEKAVSLDPAKAEYARLYADVVIANSSFDKGEQFLNSQIERKETASLYYQLGRIQTERFRRDPSIEERQRAAIASINNLSKAIELDPSHWEARLARGIVYFFIPPPLNQTAEAIADFEWLVKERPDLAVAHRYLIDSYIKANDTARAKEALREAVNRFPEDEKLKERSKRLAQD